MAARGIQRADLRTFSTQVIRQLSLTAIVFRNAGKMTSEQYEMFEEVMDELTLGLVETMLDGFEPKCDVNRAVNELIPMPNMLRAGGTSPLERQLVARVETALVALQGTK